MILLNLLTYYLFLELLTYKRNNTGDNKNSPNTYTGQSAIIMHLTIRDWIDAGHIP